MQLTPHFHLTELTTSQTAARLRIDNSPPGDVLENLKRTAELLEEVRAILGRPILISSGYRSPAVNRAVGGVANSAHTAGQAADFTCPGYGSVYEVWRRIARSDVRFDQNINEFGSWVHLAWAENNRQQTFLIA